MPMSVRVWADLVVLRVTTCEHRAGTAEELGMLEDWTTDRHKRCMFEYSSGRRCSGSTGQGGDVVQVSVRCLGSAPLSAHVSYPRVHVRNLISMIVLWS